ncbi:hypothetical protein [Salmonella phage Lumpael]|uniref:Uncharacterized protein n=1 Tax=Salmonella phage Lumpael TaxID=2488859 RepID=A0A3G8F2Z5_9CAUD|nr:hypothetical protein HOU68_gp03 [Salmonella phage Lumpael]AZF88750.1 hypothetical protein [Salmonella phage Lumpael]
MSITKFKTCRTCGAQARAKWTESADAFWICQSCKEKPVGEVLSGQAYRDRIAQAQKAAQQQDPRSVAMARQMAHDPRPAARGTQQDPTSDPMHILNPLNPLSPVSPLNPLNDWDDSSHRHHVAPAMSEPTECHTTSHSSGYESSSSDYSSSSYDSGSDSSSYSSGGCD